MPEDERLAKLSAICLALPEITRWYNGQHANFQVREKKFAYFLMDHYGDGVVSVYFKAAPGENTALAASDAERFFIPAYVGPKGWAGLRLDVGETYWAEVAEYVTLAYRLIAPRRLAALVTDASIR